MYYQETPVIPDVRIVLDDLVYLGQGDDLFEESKGYYDSVKIWRSEFGCMNQTSLYDLEEQIDRAIEMLGPYYSVEQSDGSFWTFKPRAEIVDGCNIKTYGLDAPLVAGAFEGDCLYMRKCRIKAWLKSRRDGKLNLALDYIDFYPEDEPDEPEPYELAPGEIDF